MTLSGEQQHAIWDGGGIAWEPVALPLGRRPLPSWVKGAHVNWHWGVGNVPTVQIKVDGDVYEWPGLRWARCVSDGDVAYIARHADGRARVHYHAGKVARHGAYRLVPLHEASREERAYWIDGAPRWHVADARHDEAPEAAAQREAESWLKQLTEHHIAGLHERDYRIEVRTVLATTQQQGYGGSAYWLEMEGGELLVLRGPWHGGPPPGCVEVTTQDRNEKPSGWARARPWFLRGGRAGLYLADDLFLRIVARYAPHVDVLRVRRSYGTRIELGRAEWGGRPKDVIYHEERMRSGRGEPAGPHWRVYFDGRGSYCGSLRMPSNGFAPGVDPTPPAKWWE